MGEFSGSFPDYTIFTCKFKTDDALYSWDVFSLQVGNILKLYGSKTHYDYDYCYNLNFFSVIFHQQLNITFRKSSAPPPSKNPLSTTPQPHPSPAERADGETLCKDRVSITWEKKNLYFLMISTVSIFTRKKEKKRTTDWNLGNQGSTLINTPPYYWLPIHFQNFVNLPHPPNFTVSQPFSNCIQIHYVKPCYDHLMKATEEWWFWV